MGECAYDFTYQDEKWKWRLRFDVSHFERVFQYHYCSVVAHYLSLSYHIMRLEINACNTITQETHTSPFLNLQAFS